MHLEFRDRTVTRSTILIVAICLTTLLAADEPEVREVAPGWQAVELGKGASRKYKVKGPFEAQLADGVWTISVPANGCGVPWKRQDEPDCAFFVHQTLSGDGAVIARLTTFDNFHKWGGAGISIRADTSPTSKHLLANAAHVQKDGQETTIVEVNFRQVIERKGIKVKKSDPQKLPCWLKVERTGNQLAGFVSADGENWTEINRREIDLPEKCLAGLVVWNRYHPGGKAVFDQVRIESAAKE